LGVALRDKLHVQMETAHLPKFLSKTQPITTKQTNAFASHVPQNKKLFAQTEFE
jgi:hypothetical protein